jgi:hypothetical protein
VPSQPGDAVARLREDVLAIQDQLIHNYKALAASREDAARVAEDIAAQLGRVVERVESRLPVPVTQPALQEVVRTALLELDAERSLSRGLFDKLMQSGVSQSLLASLIVEVLKLLG